MTVLYPTDIYLPDNISLTPTHTGILNLYPFLLDKAQKARVIPGSSNSSLFSVRQACNEGCYAVFLDTHLHVIHDYKILITGYSNYI